jgi:hypothetical protein
MLKSVWRIESSGLLADGVLLVIVVTLGSLGVRYVSPWIMLLGGFVLLLAIYRIRYKRF